MEIYKLKKEEKNVEKTFIERLIFNSNSIDEKAENLIASMEKIKSEPNGEFLLIKYLCEGLNIDVYYPRKGDNSERFDAILNFGNYKAVVEVEIPSTEILDAPRNLLDDYAVLKTRNKESKIIVPLVICWDLPNKRTDYWNVITDVKNILGIKIKTISILALAMHYWTDTPLNILNDDYFLEYSSYSIKNTEIFKKSKISKDKYLGFFTPLK